MLVELSPQADQSIIDLHLKSLLKYIIAMHRIQDELLKLHPSFEHQKLLQKHIELEEKLEKLIFDYQAGQMEFSKLQIKIMSWYMEASRFRKAKYPQTKEGLPV